MSSQIMTRTVAEPLVCHWVAVRDERGRTRMEARWAPADAQPVSTPHAA